MRRSFIHAVVTALLSITIVTPATAEPDAGWALVRSGTASSPADPTTDTLTAVVADLLATAGAPACTPRTARLDVHDLRWEEWANSYGDVAYRWFGPGSATVSTDCASRVDIAVQLTDYAPAGRPPVVRGTPATDTGTSRPVR